MKNLDCTYHKEVTDLLNNQIDSNRIAHAYLFVGSKATLKEQIAIDFAKAINDIDDLTSDKTWVDIKQYKPKGVNGYLINQIKGLISDCSKAPILSKFKVNILSNVEKLNSASANAFLKTLEEPQNYSINILLCENSNKVLPTIVSRCQIIKFKNLTDEESLSIIKNKIEVENKTTKKILVYCKGDINKVINYLGDADILDLINCVERTTKEICNSKISDWSTLEYSNAIIEKLNNITETYKTKLNEKLDDISDIVESTALKDIEKENNRKVANYQKSLMELVTAVVTTCVREDLSQGIKDTSILILESIIKLQQKLSYNVSIQSYCDVLLLKVKNDNYSTCKNR